MISTWPRHWINSRAVHVHSYYVQCIVITYNTVIKLIFTHLCVYMFALLYLFVVCVVAEIELNPPELIVMDYNLTMISCVVRFNSSEPEPSIFFRYNEIWMTPGFNYTRQTSDGLSPPSKVPCPSLYADKRRCTAFLMYVVGTPKINGSSLMCIAVVNGVRMATSTTVTITVMMEEEGELVN